MPDDNSLAPHAMIPQVREVLFPAYPALAEAIMAVRRTVCDRHVHELRRQIPAAAQLDDNSALDDLPEVLVSLARMYSKSDHQAQFALCGPGHASARNGQGFTVEEVYGEYVALRQSLRTEIVRHLQRTLDAGEEDALFSGFDMLLSGTLKSFAAQRETRLQLETTALSHFLASLAHDLRNEINGVMLSMTSLEEAGLQMQGTLQSVRSAAGVSANAELDELLREVSTCRETMESTVAAMTRLLEAERLRTQVTLHERDVALAQLMRGTIRSASRTDRGSRSDKSRAVERIDLDCPEELVIWTDPDLLGSVLANLVGNAVKYAPTGRIAFTAAAEGDGACRIRVCDRGPGIPAEKLERMFEKFERVSPGQAGGVGLGLFIARRAADLLRAKISVESEIGVGSCFTIALPPRPASP